MGQNILITVMQLIHTLRTSLLVLSTFYQLRYTKNTIVTTTNFCDPEVMSNHFKLPHAVGWTRCKETFPYQFRVYLRHKVLATLSVFFCWPLVKSTPSWQRYTSHGKHPLHRNQSSENFNQMISFTMCTLFKNKTIFR